MEKPDQEEVGLLVAEEVEEGVRLREFPTTAKTIQEGKDKLDEMNKGGKVDAKFLKSDFGKALLSQQLTQEAGEWGEFEKAEAIRGLREGRFDKWRKEREMEAKCSAVEGDTLKSRPRLEENERELQALQASEFMKSQYGFRWDPSVFEQPQSDQLKSAKRRKENKERRKAEKEKSWMTVGSVKHYDFDKVLKELCEDVEDVSMGKKAGKKSNNRGNDSAGKGDDKTNKKKQKKANGKRDADQSKLDEEAMSTGKTKPLDLRMQNNDLVKDSTSYTYEQLERQKKELEDKMTKLKEESTDMQMALNMSMGEVSKNVSEKGDNYSPSSTISPLDLRTGSPSSDEPSGHTVGQITVYADKVLGQGGFSIVCEGKFGGRKVAVKRVPNFLTKVDREAALHMKSDSHENVLRIQYMEKERVTGDTYLVLELCQGTLIDYVEGNLDVDRKMPKEFLRDATKGLIHLHKLGIVHCDIKPSNILISRPDSGIVKAVIGDFGVSKRLGNGEQSFSVTMAEGTQRWMAPEILCGDTRATLLVDVYALGWVIFYVLTGKLPFAGKSNFELLTNIVNGNKNLGQHIVKESAKFLIESMTSCDSTYRPPMDAVLEHPFFWDNKKELNFIELVSDHLPGIPQICTNLKRYKKAVLGSSNPDWGKVASRWPEFAPVLNQLRNPQQTVAKYDFTSVPALLRAVRNLSHHLAEQPREIQAVFGGNAPKTLVSDLFQQIFPQLLVGTWSLASKDIGHEPGFQEFYHEWWVNNA